MNLLSQEKIYSTSYKPIPVFDTHFHDQQIRRLSSINNFGNLKVDDRLNLHFNDFRNIFYGTVLD